jgi:hypothetical protein
MKDYKSEDLIKEFHKANPDLELISHKELVTVLEAPWIMLKRAMHSRSKEEIRFYRLGKFIPSKMLKDEK